MVASHCHSNCIVCPSCPLSVFKDIDPVSSEKLAQIKKVTHYKRSETLFHQGTPSFGIYCVESGKVKLSKINEKGAETILFIASSGDLIGYQDNSIHPEYLLTATVLQDCTACFISNEYLNPLLLSCPTIAVNLLQQNMKRMEVLSSYAHPSLHMTVINRVAILLIVLGKSFGREKDGKMKIDLRLTRQEMASMIGIASETMIRVLTELKRQGILEQQGNFLLINDMDGLRKVT